jgi:hypothetical protein
MGNMSAAAALLLMRLVTIAVLIATMNGLCGVGPAPGAG